MEKKPYDKDFLTRFSALIEKGVRILDIGCCSTAQQARFFRDYGFVVTGIDLSKNCIETAKRNFPGIDFLQMDMLEMDFADGSFDAICAFYSIIHIPDEKLNGLFNDFNRILKMNGKISITVHAGDFYGYYGENEFPVFFRTYSKRDLIDLLDKHGFKLIEMEQRQPIYDFEFQSERIYPIAEKLSNAH
ncbi:MAG: class I SAM-dependent methyltransferase [Bacteroidales bacterium]|nr:class I SAM-dependent methyltransferase [Bacteroidales bacterium]